MSDPRLSGTLTNWANSDDFGWPGTEGFEILWGTFRIENDGGSWEGPYRGATVWDVADMGAPPPSFRDVAAATSDWTWEAWLEGSGDYEGLSAWLRTDIEDMSFTSPVVALVFPGPPPPDR
jgi:hypothetical protein